MSRSTTPLLVPSRRQFMAGGLGIAALGLLGACDQSGPGASSGGKKTVSYVNKGMDFFFFVVQSEAVKRAGRKLGYTFQSTDAKQDASAQYNNWNSALLQRPAMIISDPVDSEGLAPMTNKSKQQKVPVGIIDTPLTKGETDFTVSFDNRKGGEMAGEKVAALLKKKYHGQVKGTVLNAYGALSSVAWRERKEGFEAVLKKYPDVKVLSRPTDGEETKARDVAAATLSEYPDLDAAHAPSDSITRGMVTSMKNAGKAKPIGDDHHIILVSIDGEPQSLQWARDKILDAEVSQDPVAYGQICVEMLHKYPANGKEVPLQEYSNKDYYWEKAPIVKGATGPTMIIPPYYIDGSNVDDPRQWGNVVIKDWGMSQS